MLSESMKRPGDVLITRDDVEGGLQKRQRQDEESEHSVEDPDGGNDGDVGPQHPANDNTTSLPLPLSSHSRPPEIVIIDEQAVDDGISDNQSDGLFVPHLEPGSTNETPSPRSTPANEDTAGLICYGMVGDDGTHF